jgi:ribose-phosphate pyrophosphokinase
MKVFALNASRMLGRRIAEELAHPLDPHEERDFSFGEHKARPLTAVWDEDVFVISSLHGDARESVNDKLCRLLFFTGALKDAGARSVTAVIPYLAYCRKDRKTKARDPVTTRYVAAILESVGVDAIVTLDIHSPPALDNAFRRPAINIPTIGLFADHFHSTIGSTVDSIVAPDLGGIKATRLFVDAYAELSGDTLPMAVMDKRRSEGLISGSGLIGNVGRHVLIVDDMIGSGTTICRSVEACLDAGAQRVSVGATHGLFQEGAPALFERAGIESITVTDSVDIDALGLPPEHLQRITIIDTARLFAEEIRSMRTHRQADDPPAIAAT